MYACFFLSNEIILSMFSSIAISEPACSGNKIFLHQLAVTVAVLIDFKIQIRDINGEDNDK